MKLTPDQISGTKEWNKMIKSQVETALGAKLDGEFTAANYTAGFNYLVREKKYNANTLKAFDTRVEVKDETPYLQTGYTSLYKQVIEKICYNISTEDHQKIRQEQNSQHALVASIIDSYEQSDLDDEKMKDPDVGKIMKKIEEYTGTTYDKVDFERYPYLANLCALISEYTAKSTYFNKLQMASNTARARLNAITENMKAPAGGNGGLETDKGFVCGWDNIMESEQLLDSLKREDSISFTVTANNFHEKSSHLNFKNKVNVDVPVNWFFSMGANHSDEYDLTQYTKNGAELSVTLTYSGITIVPVNPTPLSLDNKSGWYARDILEEVAAKSGKDVTGYQLADSEFNPETLFGKEGKLRRMRTLVISQQPSVKLHFSKFNCSELKKKFSEHTDVQFSICGGIVSGNHENGYSVSQCDYNEDKQALDVTFTPPKLGASGTGAFQTAYVLGGVADYFDNNVEVKKIRILDDEVDAENEADALPEELKGLKIMYRKNKDGVYELAGLYNEKEDVDYMLGDTVAVPIRSVLADRAVEVLHRGTRLYNAVGTANDNFYNNLNPKWIDIWAGYTRGIKRCYVCENDNQCEGRKNFVGAHMVMNDPHRQAPNSDEIIYLVPICGNMNTHTVRRALTLNADVPALRLTHFLPRRR